MNPERMFDPSIQFETAPEKEPPAVQPERQSRFRRETRRWLPRLLLAIPLTAGCSQERVALWAEKAFSGSNERVEHVTSSPSSSPMVFIDTDRGTTIPHEIKQEISRTLERRDRPIFVEPSVKRSTKPEPQKHSTVPHREIQHTHDQLGAVSQHTETSTAEKGSHGHAMGSRVDVPETPSFVKSPSYSSEPSHEHSIDQQHGGSIWKMAKGGHGHGEQTPHAAPIQGEHEQQHQHAGAVDIEGHHGHVSLPILAGKGGVAIEFERARPDQDPGEDRFDGEVSLESGPIFAGIRPGARIRVTDQGHQYSMGVNVLASRDLPLEAGVNFTVGGDRDLDEHDRSVVDQYEAMFGSMTDIMGGHGSHHEEGHDEEHGEETGTAGPRAEVKFTTPVGTAKFKGGSMKARTAVGDINVDPNKSRFEFSPGYGGESGSIGVQGGQVFIAPEVSVSLGKDRPPLHIGGLLTSDLEGNNKGVFVKMSTVFK